VYVIVDKADIHKKLIEKTVVSQDVHPGKDPDKKIRPKGNNNYQQQNRLIPASRHVVTAGHGNDDGDKRSRQRYRQGPAGNEHDVWVKHPPVAGQGKLPHHAAVKSFL
jgi:hypothetical protein